MYEPFYGLQESPFNQTPDSRFLFLSEQHRAAMAALLYGIEHRKGFICFTGEIGSGKTTTCRALINQLKSRQIRIGVVLNSYLSDIELLRAINDEFGLESHFESKKDLVDVLNWFLIDENRKGRIVTLIIDEAQNLPPQTLEQVRMLGNLESETTKLFQIVLVGQPELADILTRPELEQLEQRVSVRCHLRALSQEETLHYIRHRLLVAGSRMHIEFTPEALEKIRAYSRGIPRRINLLCDRCLLIGFVAESFTIDEKMVEQAIGEISMKQVAPAEAQVAPKAAGGHHWRIAATLLVSLGVLAAVLYLTLDPSARVLKARPQVLEVSPPPSIPLPELSPPSEPAESLIVADSQPASTQPVEEELSVTAELGILEELEEIEETEEVAIELPPTEPVPEPTPKPDVREVDGVLLTSEPPASAPQSAPASAPAAAIAKDSWLYDADGIVRVANPATSQLAAVLTIGRRWESRGNLDRFRTQAYEENCAVDALGYARDTLDLKWVDHQSNFDAALKMNLPVLIATKDGADLSPYCALISHYGDQYVLADPIHGLRTLSAKNLASKVNRAWTLYRDTEGLGKISPSQSSSKILKVQQFLSRQGFLDATPDQVFGPKMAEALKAFQRSRKIADSGVFDDATVLAMLTSMAPADVKLKK